MKVTMELHELEKVARDATPTLDPSLPADRMTWTRWCLECGCDPFVQYCEQCSARRALCSAAEVQPAAVRALVDAAPQLLALVHEVQRRIASARWLYDNAFLSDLHLDDCPQDDTCNCLPAMHARVVLNDSSAVPTDAEVCAAEDDEEREEIR